MFGLLPGVRAYQEGRQRRLSIRTALAVAATVVVAVIGGAYLTGSHGIRPWSAGTATVVLDYRDESVSRNETGDPIRGPKTLPWRNIEATILTPTGPEPGRYEIRLLDESGNVRLGQEAVGVMEDFAVRVKVDFDLRALQRGSYTLEIRRVGEDWDPHQVIIR
jgi:hypothetical protein